MRLAGSASAATASSLPSLRSPELVTEGQLKTALQNLRLLYRPLPTVLDFKTVGTPKSLIKPISTPVVDSGYVSEDSDDDDAVETAVEMFVMDEFEKQLATRWLTTVMARAEEMTLLSENVRDLLIEDAASILVCFNNSVTSSDSDEEALTRDFTFEIPQTMSAGSPKQICIRLNDDPLKGEDHTDVGLQTWGASIVLSDLLCRSPCRFDLTQASLPSAPRIIELGAGTGLVSLTLAKLLPALGIENFTIVATDYHQTVLSNLRANIASNFKVELPGHQADIQTCTLDWGEPHSHAPLDKKAHVIIAADVVYEVHHALALRECAAHLLAPRGIFWLLVSVRGCGRFEGLVQTVEAAFRSAQREELRNEPGRKLQILSIENLAKQRGVGRTDEREYRLFKIGWVEQTRS
ncbi:uncharacterized protein PV06_02052 [Exophiala oligosperma]|uniref:Methyltransferase small domain-containing protein n=2 Tax=Chaetothyriales TaxID=34395 RepID=A0A0D2DTE1_9EURO|nr:uncharacterized protein PV06_02052 [Exophiala oligosperma]KAJ9646232.1 hypothetical protein H2204_000895 [Knufia peltigerae]KIW46378.1 hypothetical protein PV06_02052 [Exophiala oligosperma]